jgi:hypothetical protein
VLLTGTKAICAGFQPEQTRYGQPAIICLQPCLALSAPLLNALSIFKLGSLHKADGNQRS